MIEIKCPRFPNKKRYDSVYHAKRAMIGRLRDPGVDYLRVFKCADCKGLHLTKETEQEYARRVQFRTLQQFAHEDA